MTNLEGDVYAAGTGVQPFGQQYIVAKLIIEHAVT